jgi:hypothetical protein
MKRAKSLASPVLLWALLSATVLLAQTTTPSRPPTVARPGSTTGSTTGQPSTTGSGGRTNPCWKQAGLSSSEIQRHRQIDENTRAQVQSVCSDSSLTQQQKHEKIHVLREQAHHESEAMMTPAQRQSIAGCRGQRGEGGGGGHGAHGGGGGGADPCGEPRSTRGRSATPATPMSGQEPEKEEN